MTAVGATMSTTSPAATMTPIAVATGSKAAWMISKQVGPAAVSTAGITQLNGCGLNEGLARAACIDF